ncbi:MAG TPA: hypothetical protein DDY88_06330 [Actinobacteria bacterium]|nr:hypothetical protein [Actinomycetota bacterium]
MNFPVARVASGVLGAALALVLTACGVQIQDAAEPLPSGAIPGVIGTSKATPDDAVAARRGLWFTKEGGLVPVAATYPTPTTAADVLNALVAGPTPFELADGLRTIANEPLSLDPMISLIQADEPEAVSAASRSARVAVGQSFTSLPAADQLLLLGQVVLSLSDAGWKRVQFFDETGSQLSVPLPDGRVLTGNAKASDFASLIL